MIFFILLFHFLHSNVPKNKCHKQKLVIIYTRQTSGKCAGMCMCNHMHQMDKTEWCEPNMIFLMEISINLSFQMKKKFKFQKFYLHRFLWPQSVTKILRLCSWYGLLHLQILNKMSQMPDNVTQTIVFHPYFMEITTLISIWLQLSYNGSSKLHKIFIKSVSLAIFSYHYEFFKNKISLFVYTYQKLIHLLGWRCFPWCTTR